MKRIACLCLMPLLLPFFIRAERPEKIALTVFAGNNAGMGILLHLSPRLLIMPMADLISDKTDIYTTEKKYAAGLGMYYRLRQHPHYQVYTGIELGWLRTRNEYKEWSDIKSTLNIEYSAHAVFGLRLPLGTRFYLFGQTSIGGGFRTLSATHYMYTISEKLSYISIFRSALGLIFYL